MVKFKNLKISGFKSFIDPVELPIEDGLTGIVGPNGCGKSNLVEALRWVMGESSAKNVRGQEMDDVIFSGTDDRSSRNLAEVTLTIDNTDKSAPEEYSKEEELQITRAIERGSGSSFAINNKEVRARDILLLFADSASGARSNAMVSQGQIGSIVKSKPTERRLVLEEAAGITGLYSRRHEAELRLNGAEQNLERLDDVISTLEAQMKSLKRQARQAGRYKNIGTHVRRQEGLLLYLKWKEGKKLFDNSKADFDRVEKSVNEITSLTTKKNIEISKITEKLPDLRQSITNATSDLQKLTSEQDILIKEDKDTAELLITTENRILQTKQDIERETKIVADANESINRIQKEINDLRGSGKQENNDQIESTIEDIADKKPATCLKEAQEKEEKERTHLREIESEISGIKAEEKAINELLATKKSSGWPSIIDEITPETGYEKALGAALGEDLEGSASQDAPIFWATLPPIEKAHNLPPETKPLSKFVKAPTNLSRRLNQIGVIKDQSKGDKLQKRLLPGQRLVSLDGSLWRWDGYTVRSENVTNSSKKLGYRRRLNDIRKRSEKLDQEIEIVRKRVSEAVNAVQNARNAEQDVRVFSLFTDLQRWKSQLTNSDKQTTELTARLKKYENEIQQLKHRPIKNSDRREELKQIIQNRESGRNKEINNLSELENNLSQLQEDLRKHERHLNESRENRIRVDSESKHLKENLEEVSNQIFEKIKCKPEEAPEILKIKSEKELPSLEEADARLERLIKERDNMGPVNLRAEEEAKDLENQTKTMNSEKEDLLSAISRLRQGITNLNKEGRQRLLASFDVVNKNFEKLFFQLFAGGHAHMKLVDSEDPLEAGLEIYASPPGKKLKTLTLLSGGEQALTAIAVIFAVFLANPAPICVLDEVDAPLDDSNVDRFCQLLKEITKTTHTRFLIVTHHRVTMAKVDKLFGVTMEERGVSKLVSVDLKTAEGLREVG